jgi:hypothetical protein
MFHISVESKTQWTISHGGFEIDVPAKLIKMIENKPFLRMQATHYKLAKLVCGHEQALPHNRSFANNTGLKKLKELRNKASGLCPPVAPAVKVNLLDEDDDPKDEEDIPAKQPPKKVRRTAVPQALLPELVVFDLDGYGVVRALRAKHPTENLWLSLEAEVLHHVFHYITDVARDEEKMSRAYIKTGKFKKQQ